MKTVQELTDIANGRIDAMCVTGLTPDSDQEDKDVYIQKVINEDARAFLASTDWYVTRFTETAVAIPGGVTTDRATARSRIVEE